MKTNKPIMLIIVLVMLLATSCQTPRTSRVSQTEIQLVQYSLKKADLPGSGWSIEGEGWGADYGGESYGITFIREQHVFVNHIVSMHSSEDRAQQAYKAWEAEWFETTNLQPDILFSPSDQDDDYRYECEELQPGHPLMVCFYLQRHNQIISFVRINLDNGSINNLTFADINDILAILEERLNEVVIEETP